MTDWSAVQRDESRKVHESEIASLRKELEVARAALENATKARRTKIPAAGVARRRSGSDIVRVIIPDTHGCLIDKQAVAAMLTDIKALDPQEIILLGDHVDCGGFLAQHHVMGYVAETDYTYEEDLDAAKTFLNALQAAAPRARIEYLEGNHERRVETWCVTQVLRHKKDAEGLRRLLAPEFRLGLKERGIAYYRQGEFYDNLPVPGVIKRGKCFFFHGVSTARNAVSATVDKIAGNCVFGHTHRAQSNIVRRISSGVIGAWNPGCLCQLQPLWQHTAPTDWSHGYAVQLVAEGGAFLHLNIPIIEGESHFAALLKL
jgi:UDP-2,3-diacylglucosamine pyrophosphatase LpxH